MITAGNYEKNGSTFSIGSNKYMIQNQYGLRIVKLKPKFEHVSKLYKLFDNQYKFDVVGDQTKNHYVMTIKNDEIIIENLE